MPRIAKNKDESAVQNMTDAPKVKKVRKTKEAAEVITVAESPKTDKPLNHGYVFYSLYSRSRGWVMESMNLDNTCAALDEYYYEWMNKVNFTGKKLVFDYYIMKRDTRICHTNCEHYQYFPGSFTERKREEHLRAKYGDRYREESEEDYDYSKYAEDFNPTVKN